MTDRLNTQREQVFSESSGINNNILLHKKHLSEIEIIYPVTLPTYNESI